MSSVVWSVPRSVAPVGSHPLPTMHVNGQQRGLHCWATL
jgi:hypothetical protein